MILKYGTKSVPLPRGRTPNGNYFIEEKSLEATENERIP
jgi:hypothetical protein